VKTRGVVGALVAATMMTSSFALASGPEKALAKQAYDRGLEAHKRGDLHLAAEEFARADALAPSAVALQAALNAAIEADDAPLGAELLERSKRAPATPGLASSITAAHLKFNGQTGRLIIHCPSGSTCTARLDDKPVDVDRPAWARTGPHNVVVQVDGQPQTKLIDVASNQTTEVTLGKGAQPSSTTAAAAVVDASTSDTPPSKRGETLGRRLPPIFFYGGLGLTTLLAGATTYFAIDASSQHGSFTDAGCERANFAQCAALKDDGESSQTLANIGLASTAVVGIGTAVVGLVFTDWNAPLFAVRRDGGTAAWRLTF
jgi:hypothetical protein